MGEMVINSMRGEIPVVTIRPSVTESTLTDPFPGWIQGNRMADPIIIYYGKGQMDSFLGNPDCVFDVVPADMVVNVALASMAKHGGTRVVAEPGMHVYHVASSSANPLVLDDLFKFMYRHFTRSPLVDAAGQPIPVRPMRFCHSMEQYASNVRSRDLHAKVVAKIVHLGLIYEPYTFYGGRFDTANTEALFADMSEEEKETFHFDMRSVDWEDYFTNVHISGVRRHVMKGRGSPCYSSACA
ncbi:unnamed protein product [Urochloa humidicola]